MTQDQGTTSTIENNVLEVPAGESFNTEALQGSMQQILSENIGRYVTVLFLIGTTVEEERSGYIYSVGMSFIVLNDVINRVFIVCDIFSIKFATFYYPTEYPTTPAETPTSLSVRQDVPVATDTPATQSVAATRPQPSRQAAFNYAKRQGKGRL